MKWIDRKISHEEYLSGKYQSTSHQQGSEHWARVYVDDNGNIDPAASYTDRYQREQGIGKYADKPSEKSEKKTKTKTKKEKKPLWKRILFAPFKFLWWIIKKILLVVTLGVLSETLGGSKKKK